MHAVIGILIPHASHVTFRELMRDRYQGIALDLFLIAWAALFPFHPVEDWLLRHAEWVYWTMGCLHLVALPWIVLWMLATMDRPDEEARNSVFGPNNGPFDKLFIYSFVLFFCGGWMIPLFLGFAQNIDNRASYFGFLFGPFALLGIVVVIALKIEKWRRPQTPPQTTGPGPLAVQATLLFIAAYLSLTETSLLCIRLGKRVLSDTDNNLGLCLALTTVSYLPTRLALFRFQAKSRSEFITLTLAFLHLLYRLSAAT